MQKQTYFTPEMIDQTYDAKYRLLLELENLKKQYGYRITAAAVSAAQHEFIGNEVGRVVDEGRVIRTDQE